MRSTLYQKYKHGIPLVIYGIVYLVWFSYLEHHVTHNYMLIHTVVDDYIPFCEWFIIPYLLWFAYMGIVVMYFFFKDHDEYYQVCTYLFTGMTIFLLISTFFPNGQHLRPLYMPRDNFCTALVAALYKTDTPTNLWPSIHVYNSLGVHLAVCRSRQFGSNRKVKTASFIMCVSIILSTMFLKQHSFFDVTTAFIMATVMYLVVYRLDVVLAFRRRLQARAAVREQQKETAV